jgi:hypothetical protein
LGFLKVLFACKAVAFQFVKPDVAVKPLQAICSAVPKVMAYLALVKAFGTRIAEE